MTAYPLIRFIRGIEYNFIFYIIFIPFPGLQMNNERNKYIFPWKTFEDHLFFFFFGATAFDFFRLVLFMYHII